MILVWSVVIGLLSLGAIVAAHGFTTAVQSAVTGDPSPPRN